MTNQHMTRLVKNRSSRSLRERYRSGLSYSPVESVRQHQEIVRQHQEIVRQH